MSKLANNRKPVLYLAGGISKLEDKDAKDWREYVKKIWKKEWCLDPLARRDYRGKEMTEQAVSIIVEMDKRDILASDILFTNYIKPSVGTSMEVLFAWERHIPVILVNSSGSRDISPWILYHSTVVVDTIDEGLEWIRDNV